MVALAALLLSVVSCRANDEVPESMDVYIGTYTQGDSEGIYLLGLNMKTGELTNRGLAAKCEQPSFVAIHPNRNFLYAVGEYGSFGTEDAGAIVAFSIDAQSGELTELNKVSSGGPGPCHLVVDAAGGVVLAANYGGGSVCSVEIKDDGALGAMRTFVQHTGSSVDERRQRGPHAHSINVDPANRFAFAADLGLDKVLVYRFDAEKGTLEANDPPSVSITPGGGPRHFAFHPGGRFAWVLQEMTSRVTGFAYDADAGVLSAMETLSTLPSDHETSLDGSAVGNSTAEVQVSPSGRFLYASNRGHDSIVVYAIDQQTGKLTYVENEKTGGRTPRNFGIDPTGAYLLAANQSTGSVVVFRIDAETGALEPTGERVDLPSPVCVKFIPR